MNRFAFVVVIVIAIAAGAAVFVATALTRALSFVPSPTTPYFSWWSRSSSFWNDWLLFQVEDDFSLDGVNRHHSQRQEQEQQQRRRRQRRKLQHNYGTDETNQNNDIAGSDTTTKPESTTTITSPEAACGDNDNGNEWETLLLQEIQTTLNCSPNVDCLWKLQSILYNAKQYEEGEAIAAALMEEEEERHLESAEQDNAAFNKDNFQDNNSINTVKYTKEEEEEGEEDNLQKQRKEYADKQLQHAIDQAKKRAEETKALMLSSSSSTLYPFDPSLIDTKPFLSYRLIKKMPKKTWPYTMFPDITIVGLPKAGTSQLSYLLRKVHPGSTAFSPVMEDCFQIRLHLERDSKNTTFQSQHDMQKALFAYFTYKEHKRAEAEKEAAAAAAANMTETTTNNNFQKKQEDGKLLSVSTCHGVDDIILRAHYLKPRMKLRFLYLLRDPADWLWSAWNFWVDNHLDWIIEGEEKEDTRRRLNWAQEGLDYRSPELFHELMVGGMRLTAGARLIGMRARAIIDLRKLRQAFGSDAVWIARSEDMLPPSQQQHMAALATANNSKGGNSGLFWFLDRLANFTGLSRDGFNNEETQVIHNCNDNKGSSSSCGKNYSKTNAYAISGYRSMLPETRTFIYLHFHEECKIWNTEFGVEYPDCLNVLSSSSPS